MIMSPLPHAPTPPPPSSFTCGYITIPFFINRCYGQGNSAVYITGFLLPAFAHEENHEYMYMYMLYSDSVPAK